MGSIIYSRVASFFYEKLDTDYFRLCGPWVFVTYSFLFHLKQNTLLSIKTILSSWAIQWQSWDIFGPQAVVCWPLMNCSGYPVLYNKLYNTVTYNIKHCYLTFWPVGQQSRAWHSWVPLPQSPSVGSKEGAVRCCSLIGSPKWEKICFQACSCGCWQIRFLIGCWTEGLGSSLAVSHRRPSIPCQVGLSIRTTGLH